MAEVTIFRPGGVQASAVLELEKPDSKPNGTNGTHHEGGADTEHVELDAATEVVRLAQLSHLLYAAERSAVAKALKIPVGILDKEVAKARAAIEAERKEAKAKAAPQSTDTAPCDPTEDAVAAAFAKAYTNRLAYDHTEGSWFIWRDGRWLRDGRNIGFHAARMFTREVRSKLAEPPASLTKIAFAAAVERAAQADPRLAVSQEVWDTDQWLLGTPDGVVDLKTGAMFPSRPDLYISRHTSVSPAPPGTPAPIWSKFLADATKGDKEFQDFLMRLCGYCLTGDISEEVLSFLYGPGGNGKGTFLLVLTGIMGDYAISMPIETFMAGSRINLEYYRAQMAGARLVTASETEAHTTWAESQIKEITGNDHALSGRHPRGRPFEFWPQAKIIINGNHAPKLKTRTPAMERRLRMAPFTHKPKPDLGLKTKLKAEFPAILRMMIEGCLEWKKKGLGTAKVVQAATEAYFERQDVFRRWMDERCARGKAEKEKPGLLLAGYNAWAKANGEAPLDYNSFAEMIDLIEGLERTRSHGVRYVTGISLRVIAPEEVLSPENPEGYPDE